MKKQPKIINNLDFGIKMESIYNILYTPIQLSYYVHMDTDLTVYIHNMSVRHELMCRYKNT